MGRHLDGNKRSSMGDHTMTLTMLHKTDEYCYREV